jgi:hypothetical protein
MLLLMEKKEAVQKPVTNTTVALQETIGHLTKITKENNKIFLIIGPMMQLMIIALQH